MVSVTSLYTIRALALLAPLPDGAYLGAAALAQQIDAPPNYLGKLLRVMARAGIVRSRKGTGGGFRLARDPATISLRDVIEPIDQTDRWTGCLLGRPVCSDDDACVVHARWTKLRDDYLALLSKTSIQELAVPDHADGKLLPRRSDRTATTKQRRRL